MKLLSSPKLSYLESYNSVHTIVSIWNIIWNNEYTISIWRDTTGNELLTQTKFVVFMSIKRIKSYQAFWRRSLWCGFGCRVIPFCIGSTSMSTPGRGEILKCWKVAVRPMKSSTRARPECHIQFGCDVQAEYVVVKCGVSYLRQHRLFCRLRTEACVPPGPARENCAMELLPECFRDPMRRCLLPFSASPRPRASIVPVWIPQDDQTSDRWPSGNGCRRWPTCLWVSCGPVMSCGHCN